MKPKPRKRGFDYHYHEDDIYNALYAGSSEKRVARRTFNSDKDMFELENDNWN